MQSLEALLVWTRTQQKLFVQAQASFDLLPRRFLDPTVAAPQPERRSATRQRAGDGLRGSKEQNVAFCKRREGIVLSACLIHRQLPCSSPPKLSLLVATFPSMRRRGPMFPGKQRRGVRRYGQREKNTPSSLHTTSASSFDYHHSSLSTQLLRLFTRGVRTLSSTMPPKLMSIQAFSPADSGRRSVHQVTPSARTSLSVPRVYSGLAWEYRRPAHMAPTAIRKLPRGILSLP
ncbi:hypothetical protein ARMGADRAFT_592747 [Armillaria gallica]|uniref:Uncharacterized protein n=1 Tax=Armillaria gallica TaxID=47427 RepID=A0A2H3DA38_ARMGA|nr:hypothetical protein ARMGADRAFT_592747 [Armillaria gallica]